MHPCRKVRIVRVAGTVWVGGANNPKKMHLSNKIWLAFFVFFVSGFILEIFILVCDRTQLRSSTSSLIPPFQSGSSNAPGRTSLSLPQEPNQTVIGSNYPLESQSTSYGESYNNHRFHNFSHVLYGSHVPPIVQSWRQATVDWHSLLPRHLSQWQRYGKPNQEGKARLLVSKEEQVTDYLTMFHTSGLSTSYGVDFGPMTNYAACDSIADPCMIYTEKQCQINGFCIWDKDSQLCRDITSYPHSNSTYLPSRGKCANPLQLPERQNPTGCEFYIHEPVVMVRVDHEAQTMFYHWWSAWQSMFQFWTKNLDQNQHIHFIIEDVVDPMFFHYFGLLSSFCWRRMDLSLTVSKSPKLCFCNVKYTRAVQSRVDHKGSATYMIQALGLGHVKPSSSKARIGLISRRRKRFILNEYELVTAAQSLGYECTLLPLESMTLYEQIQELRSLDVLIGVHGSALDNAVFLPDRAVLVQLLPYKVKHKATFVEDTKLANAVYMEWQATDPGLSVFHWDLLEEANPDKYRDKQYDRDEVLKQGDPQKGMETLMFWINQDIIVPIEEWKELLQRAVRESPAVQRGVKVG